jgi:hypothetical protein
MKLMTSEEFLAEREQRELSYPPDWMVTECYRNPGDYYRYTIVGINLNYPEGHMDRYFRWRVPDIDCRFFLPIEDLDGGGALMTRREFDQATKENWGGR